MLVFHALKKVVFCVFLWGFAVLTNLRRTFIVISDTRKGFLLKGKRILKGDMPEARVREGDCRWQTRRSRDSRGSPSQFFCGNWSYS